MRLLATMLLIFIAAQLLGIFTGIAVLTDMSSNPFVSDLVVTTDASDPVNALFFMGYILAGAVLMMVMIRYFGLSQLLFRAMEFFLVASTSSIVFYAFLRLVAGYEVSTLAGIFMGLAFSGARAYLHGLKNAAAVFATAGVGVIFGVSLGLVPMLIFLIFLSFYDFLAVFATKHMVALAEFVVKKDLAFTVTARAPPVRLGEREQRIDLGTGDMIAPIMLEVATLQVSPVATLFVFVGA
ncbi:hypothetical protein H0O00_04420, partial [Candidatus Micrarchaeota archaeon]|nr:hypothetical protein [Candidatus Micrarchaeota archaeon]